MRSTVFLSLLALSLCACPKDGGDEASSTNGEGEAETSDSSASESSGETGEDVCAGFVDATVDPPYRLVINNTRAEPVYLMTNDDCTVNHVHIVGDAGHWPPGDCEPTCAQMIAGYCACPGACAAPQLLRIEAGETHSLDWAYVLAPDDVPETCVDPALCGFGACPQAIVPPAGTYTVELDVAFAPAECAGMNDPCACGPGEGSCVTSVIYQDPPDLELALAVELPDGSLELAIE